MLLVIRNVWKVAIKMLVQILCAFFHTINTTDKQKGLSCHEL